MSSPDIIPANRQQPRVASSGLEAAIVHRRFVWLTDYEYCFLVNINTGGVGIASESLDIKAGKTLELEIYHGTETFVIKGVVMHKSRKDGAHHYGLAFVETPPALDRLIDLFLKAHIAQANTRTEGGQGKKRQPGSHRVKIDAQMYVRRHGSNEAFVLCKVENVSRGGLGFSCLHRFGDAAPFDVEAKISEREDAPPLLGTVVHLQKRLNRYHYGLEFQRVPEELLRLVELMEGTTS